MALGGGAGSSRENYPWHMDGAYRAHDVDGVRWSFIDTGGDLPAVVMLPGSVGTSEMFYRQIDGLRGRLRVIAVSYPALSHPAELARGLHGVIEHLELRSFGLVGSSFAGHWVAFFAARYPQRLSRLVLGNTFASGEDLRGNPLFEPDWIERVGDVELRDVWLARVRKAPDSELKRIQIDMLENRQSAANLRSRFVGVVRARGLPEITSPRIRVVVLDCADDPIIPEHAREAVRRRYSHSEIITLERGGHYPHILNPDKYNEEIAKIMDK